jgi:uncharacterized repeat protein (TIGR03803 family)
MPTNLSTPKLNLRHECNHNQTMKTKLQNLIKTGRNAALRRPCHCVTIPLMLLAVLSPLLANRVTAQTFTNLYSFTATYTNSSFVYTNGDGAYPSAGLILSGNTLYGTAPGGGTNGNGTVFAVHTDGTGFTVLHNFTATHTNSSFVYTNGDGAYPSAGLILSGNTLYGTAPEGGTNGNGTVFSLTTDGTGFTTLHTFALISSTNSDGANPQGTLIVSGGTLYGTAGNGGAGGNGTVFAINTDGMDFTNLHNFAAYSHGINSEGANPQGTLIVSGSTLYGTTFNGGAGGNGTVFAIGLDGTGFTNLYSFTAYPSTPDGANPFAGLVLSGNTLYGTTHSGGANGGGTVFAVTTNGTGFMNLHSFTGLSDGDNPYAGLVLSGSTLLGTAGNGGNSFDGTLFAVTTNGTGFTTLHTFTNSPDGVSPHAGLILSGNTLYGTTEGGGANGYGMVFSLSLPTPQLAIGISGTNIVLTWPTNALTFTLQSTTSLDPVWSPVTNSPAVSNGQNTLAFPIPASGTQRFYRLSL